MNPHVYVMALTRFDKEQDAGNHRWYPTLPADPGIVHSYRDRMTAASPTQPLILDSPFEYRIALCGAKVKVVLPTAFRLDDDDACQTCVALTHREQETGSAAPGTRPFRPPSGNAPRAVP